jgi:hypothetical protein
MTKGNLMARNKNMRRRHNDVKIDMIPKWLRILMIVIKGSLVIIPFIISSIAMFYESDMGIMESGIWNCIWMFSLLHMINYVDEK